MTHDVESTNATQKPIDDHFHRFLARTSRLLGMEALYHLRESCLLIAGCGGVGGAATVTMARAGIGRFILADPGVFDPPDINRQWAADISTLGKNKADAYQQVLQRINPEVNVTTYTGGITWDNVESLVAQADLVIDGLDFSLDLALRARMFDLARAKGIYCISAPAIGFGTLVAIASPHGMPMQPFVELLKRVKESGTLPKSFHDFYAAHGVEALERNLPLGVVPTISLGPALSGVLLCTEAIVILLKNHMKAWRDPVSLPTVLLMDALAMNYRTISIETLNA